MNKKLKIIFLILVTFLLGLLAGERLGWIRRSLYNEEHKILNPDWLQSHFQRHFSDSCRQVSELKRKKSSFLIEEDLGENLVFITSFDGTIYRFTALAKDQSIYMEGSKSLCP